MIKPRARIPTAGRKGKASMDWSSVESIGKAIRLEAAFLITYTNCYTSNSDHIKRGRQSWYENIRKVLVDNPGMGEKNARAAFDVGGKEHE